MAFFTNHEYVGGELKRPKKPRARYAERTFTDACGERARDKALESLPDKRELIDRPIAEWDVGPLLILL